MAAALGGLRVVDSRGSAQRGCDRYVVVYIQFGQTLASTDYWSQNDL